MIEHKLPKKIDGITMEKISKVGIDVFISSLYEKMSQINKSERICIFEVYRLIECSNYC